MGFLDLLFGKKRKTVSKPPRPKVIAGQDDNSLQVIIDNGDDGITIMDREMFDYQYGESDAPDPAQQHLDELLSGATCVRAIASGMFRGRALGSEVILETSDGEALNELRKALRIVEDPSTFVHCACLGGPTLEFYSGQKLVITVGLQHGHSIRWAQWRHDARLSDGQALNDWLTKHGIEPVFLDVLLNNQYDMGGMMPLGFQRKDSTPLSRAEQRVRLAELKRVRSGDLENALAECQNVLEEEPNLALGYVVRALIHNQGREYACCVADCTEAIRLGLLDAKVFFTRAVARDCLGQPQEALADCTSALEIDPKYTGALNSRGLIRMRLGMLDEALADLNSAIELSPDWSLPYLHRAQTFHKRGDFDLALADYNRVINMLSQQSPDADHNSLLSKIYWNRGQIHRRKDNEALAKADFREATRLDPRVAERL